MLEVNGKPWFASESVWGSVGAIAGSLGTAYVAWKNGQMEVAMTAVGTAFSALIALIGRVRATKQLTP